MASSTNETESPGFQIVPDRDVSKGEETSRSMIATDAMIGMPRLRIASSRMASAIEWMAARPMPPACGRFS